MVRGRSHQDELSSLRPEKPVARISQTRADITVRVEFAVDRRRENGHVGMSLLKHLQSFGGGEKTQEPDLCRTGFLEAAHGRGGRVARRQHGVDDDRPAIADIRRQFEVVSMGTSVTGSR